MLRAKQRPPASRPTGLGFWVTGIHKGSFKGIHKGSIQGLGFGSFRKFGVPYFGFKVLTCVFKNGTDWSLRGLRLVLSLEFGAGGLT